jgi:hypothetical protein
MDTSLTTALPTTLAPLMARVGIAYGLVSVALSVLVWGGSLGVPLQVTVLVSIFGIGHVVTRLTSLCERGARTDAMMSSG